MDEETYLREKAKLEAQIAREDKKARVIGKLQGRERGKKKMGKHELRKIRRMAQEHARVEREEAIERGEVVPDEPVMTPQQPNTPLTLTAALTRHQDKVERPHVPRVKSVEVAESEEVIAARLDTFLPDHMKPKAPAQPKERTPTKAQRREAALYKLTR